MSGVENNIPVALSPAEHRALMEAVGMEYAQNLTICHFPQIITHTIKI